MRAVEGWTTGRLGELCTIEIGGTPSRSNPEFWDAAKDTSNFWVSIRDLNHNVITDTSEYISDLGVKRSNVKLQKPGTVLLSFKLSIGRVAFAGVPLFTNEAIAGLSSDKIDLNYLFQGLHYWDLLKDVDQAIKGATLNKAKLKQITFDYPTSLSEQTKIADILSTVDRAIEQTEALIAKQQRIKTGLMQDLLTRGIDEHGNLRSEKTHKFKDSPLGRIPMEWTVGSFDDYVINDAGIKPGPFGSSLTKDMYVESGCRVYGQEQVIGGSLDLGDYFISERKFNEMEGFAVRAGDVLISLVGTIGHVLIVPEGHHPGIINPRLLRFRPDIMHCLPTFLKAVLLSQPIRLQLDAFATGGTMPVISAGIIRKLRVVAIGVDEQVRIVQTIYKSNESIVSSSDRLNKLRALKTALMQDLLTGKKRVTVLLNYMEAVRE
jgi:type I restriction enzyme, S subunit